MPVLRALDRHQVQRVVEPEVALPSVEIQRFTAESKATLSGLKMGETWSLG